MAQIAAADAAKCVAVIIEQRMRAQLPADLVGEVLAIMADAVQHQVAAANAFAGAHRKLAEIRDRLGVDLTAYGPDCEAVNGVKLTVVTAAA
jgi:hypothetical protein